MTARLPLVRAGGRTKQLPAGDTLLGAGTVNFTDTSSIVSPNDTVYASVLTAKGATANIDAVVAPLGSGSFALQVADGTAVGGAKRGLNSADLQKLRTSASQVVSGQASFAAGANNSVASSFSAAVGRGNSTSGNWCYAFGDANILSGAQSIAIGVSNNNNSTLGAILGGAFGYTRGVTGYNAWAGAGTALGQTQLGQLILRADTTTAAATRLTSDKTTAVASNIGALPSTSSYRCRIEVVARNTTTGDSASWDCKALIKREANAAATSVVGTPVVTQEFASSAMAACIVTITADTTLGGLSVMVTGIAATNIRWTAYIESLEATN